MKPTSMDYLVFALVLGGAMYAVVEIAAALKKRKKK